MRRKARLRWPRHAGLNKATFVYMGDVCHVAVSGASECLKAGAAGVTGGHQAAGACSGVVSKSPDVAHAFHSSGSYGIKMCEFKTLLVMLIEGNVER